MRSVERVEGVTATVTCAEGTAVAPGFVRSVGVVLELGAGASFPEVSGWLGDGDAFGRSLPPYTNEMFHPSAAWGVPYAFHRPWRGRNLIALGALTSKTVPGVPAHPPPPLQKTPPLVRG